MRRFSQRSPLVTLSEINITPLLDLAFVLLIIFVITTPMLEQGLDLALPEGGRPDRKFRIQDIVTIDVGPGFYKLRGQTNSLGQVAQWLQRERQANPRLLVQLRADVATPYNDVFQLLDLCQNLDVAVNFRSLQRSGR